METRFRHIFLALLLAMPALFSVAVTAAEPAEAERNEEAALIQPEVDRREFDEAQIDEIGRAHV